MTQQESLKTNLTRSSINNGWWSVLSMITTSGTHFIIGIFLARMLEPRDFGIVAFTMVFVTITGRITEFGVGPAIVQTRGLNPHHLRSGFTLTVLFAFTSYAFLFVIAPYIASDVHCQVLRVAALSLVICAVGLVPNAILQRELRFRHLFYIELMSSMVGYGAISVVLALLHGGLWSLVLGNLSYLLIRNVACYIVAPHSLRLSLTRKETGDLLRYGLGMSLGTLANVFARNGHLFIVGSVLGDVLLGIYQRGYALVMFPVSSCSGATTSVLFPTLAEVQHEQDRLARGFLVSVSLTSFFLFPLMAALALCAPEIIIGLLTSKWQAAIPVMRLFCILGVFASIYPLGDALGRACGRVYIKSVIHAVYAVISIGLCYVAASYGILYVAAAMTISVFTTYSLMSILAVRILKISMWHFWAAQLSGVFSGLMVLCLCCPVTWVGRSFGIPPIVLLTLQGAAVLIGLGVALFCLPEGLAASPRRIASDYLNRLVSGALRPRAWDRLSC